MPRKLFILLLLSFLFTTTSPAIAQWVNNRFPENPSPGVDEKWTYSPPVENVEQGRRLALQKMKGTDKIIFIRRDAFSSNHYYTEYINSRWTPGVNLCILDLKTGKITDILPEEFAAAGIIARFDLNYEADKIVFDYKDDQNNGYRIWEVKIDGTGLRQVLAPPADEAKIVEKYQKGYHHGTDDMHPCYLPDGDICFISTRCQYGILCDPPDVFSSTILYRVKPDGTGLRALSNSSVSEQAPSVTPDGRIIYSRWEYVDKGARVGKTIWTMNPDGTKPQHVYGLADDTTTVYMYPQPVPGVERRVVCVGTCHFPQGGCFGAVMLVDYGTERQARGPDPDEPNYIQFDPNSPVTNLTPHVFVERRTEPGWHFKQENGSYKHDRNGTSGHLYTTPWPVSKNEFLVSYKVKPTDHYKQTPNAYSLYLIDTEGNQQLVHADPTLSCFHPTPIVARKLPPAVRTMNDPELAKKNQALCVLTNVYQGMEGVEPGEVKWLRVNEALPRYWSTGRRWSPALSSSSWKAALWPRVQWGVVPVEKDGSAQFVVPANRGIFLQALDENFQEIQRERTYVNYSAGEVRSCTGCHGQSNLATTSLQGTGTPIALTRAPSMPQPQPCDEVKNGGDGLAGQVIHYPTDIQPIFNSKCISCHGEKEPKGDLRLTGEVTTFYNTSYETLARKRLAGPIIPEFTSFLQGDRGNYNGAFLPPRSLGSPTSPMIEILTDPDHPKNAEDDHTKMLTKMELMRLSRWADSNYQFYGCYYGRQHPRWVEADPGKPDYDPADFRRKATFEEAVNIDAPEWHR